MKTLRRGGAEVLAASLAAAHRSDVEMLFGYFHAGQDTLAAQLEALGVRAICIPSYSQAGIIASADRIARLLVRERIDLVHCHLPLVGSVGRLASSYAGKPLVYTEHNLFSSYHPATRLMARATWHLQRHVIVVSEEVRRSLPSGDGGPPVTLVRNAVDVARFHHDAVAGASMRATLGIPRDARVVGTVAVFRPAKRLDRWLRVAKGVAARDPGAHFLLVGFGPLEQEVRDWAGAAGLGSRLVMPGPQDDVRPFLSAMDLYLMTSDFEGLPIALLEAMAQELPVVSTAVGGIPEVLVDGEMGALVPRDIDAIVERVTSLLRSETLTLLGRRGRARIDERHGIGAMARTIEQIYDDVLAS